MTDNPTIGDDSVLREVLESLNLKPKEEAPVVTATVVTPSTPVVTPVVPAAPVTAPVAPVAPAVVAPVVTPATVASASAPSAPAGESRVFTQEEVNTLLATKTRQLSENRIAEEASKLASDKIATIEQQLNVVLAERESLMVDKIGSSYGIDKEVLLSTKLSGGDLENFAKVYSEKTKAASKPAEEDKVVSYDSIIQSKLNSTVDSKTALEQEIALMKSEFSTLSK